MSSSLDEDDTGTEDVVEAAEADEPVAEADEPVVEADDPLPDGGAPNDTPQNRSK